MQEFNTVFETLVLLKSSINGMFYPLL